MEFLCKFTGFQNITGSYDGVVFLYKFMCTSLDKVGQPDKEFNITVKCTGTRLTTWGLKGRDPKELQGQDLEKVKKVLYWYAREAFRENPDETEQEKIVHDRNSPEQCPVDPDRIDFSDTFKIEYHRRIGF